VRACEPLLVEVNCAIGLSRAAWARRTHLPPFATPKAGRAMTVRVVSLRSFASAPGVLTVGQSVTFTATTNRPVVVEGIPTLITSDGQVAFYFAALSTPTSLVFRYTVGL